jgi:hypothetical protein
MNIVLTDPIRYSYISNREGNEIREIFYQHWEKMKNQMKGVIDEINMWRFRSIQDINSYANEQVRILQADYNHQRDIFDQKREENLGIAKAYHQTKQTNLFKELIIACRSLEFQVAQLVYIRNQNNRPKVITVEDETRTKKQDTTNRHVFEFENRRIRSTIEDANVREINGGNISRLSIKSIPNEIK